MFILKDKCKNCLCVPNSQTSVCGWMPSFLGGVFFGVNQITELMRRSPLLLYDMLSLSQFSELSKKCYLETKPCSHRLGKSQMRRHLFPTTSCTFLFKIFACCCLKVSREDLSLASQQSWHVLQKHCIWKGLSGGVGEVMDTGAERATSSEMWHSEAHHWQEPPRDALFPVHLHCKCGQRALVTYWPDSSSFQCQNVPCLLEKWTPAGCSSRLLLSGPGLGACFFSTMRWITCQESKLLMCQEFQPWVCETGHRHHLLKPVPVGRPLPCAILMSGSSTLIWIGSISTADRHSLVTGHFVSPTRLLPSVGTDV